MGPGEWLMESVLEVWENTDGTAICYTLDDQKRYFFPSASAAPAEAYTRKIFG